MVHVACLPLQVNKELIEWLDGRKPSSELEWKLYDKTVRKLISVGLEQLEVGDGGCGTL